MVLIETLYIYSLNYRKFFFQIFLIYFYNYLIYKLQSNLSGPFQSNLSSNKR